MNGMLYTVGDVVDDSMVLGHDTAMLVEAISAAHRLLVCLREIGGPVASIDELQALIPALQARLASGPAA